MTFHHFLILSVLIGSWSVSQCALADPPERPNIVIFSIDTLRADHLGCYGYPRETSPALDQFAREGILFSRVISQAPLTTPSHISLFTGLTPPAHQVQQVSPQGISNALSEAILSLPEILQTRGYLTLGLHGGGAMNKDFGFGRGFDDYLLFFTIPQTITEPEILWRRAETKIREFIDAGRKKNRPLFLFLHHYYCHSPYVKSPENFRLKFIKDPPPGLPVVVEQTGSGINYSNIDKDFWSKLDLSNPVHRRHAVDLYDGAVAYSDYLVSRLIELLKAEGSYDNTLLIILSDHGEEFYEHQGQTYGRLFGEHLLVPLLIKFPGKENQGKVVSSPVRIIDVMPSILDYFTIPLPSMQGVSFLPLLKDDKIVPAPLPVSYTGNDYGIYRAIRLEKDGYAYIHNTAEKLGDEWLIDLRNDPQEQRNLAEERPDLLIKFRAAAAAELQKDEAFSSQTAARPSESFPVDSNLRKQLKALGYLN